MRAWPLPQRCLESGAHRMDAGLLGSCLCLRRLLPPPAWCLDQPGALAGFREPGALPVAWMAGFRVPGALPGT